jgi:hypothetical protein
MDWKFDQDPDVACITSRAVIDGSPVLFVTHLEDDHSWAFFENAPTETIPTMLVAMSDVVDRHPDLPQIADLPPGWSATRESASAPWLTKPDE